MAEYITKDDIRKFYSEFAENAGFETGAPHFSVNDILSNLDNIKNRPVLELNETTEQLLHQLGYFKMKTKRQVMEEYGIESMSHEDPDTPADENFIRLCKYVSEHMR